MRVRDPALDVARLGEARLDAGTGARERRRRVPRLLVVVAPHRLAVLAKGVLNGLERLAGLAAKELVREDLADPRLRARPTPVPVLVDERADPRLDARAAHELDDVLDVAKRPQDEEVRGPVDPGAFGDRGAPAGDASLDLRAAPCCV